MIDLSFGVKVSLEMNEYHAMNPDRLTVQRHFRIVGTPMIGACGSSLPDIARRFIAAVLHLTSRIDVLDDIHSATCHRLTYEIRHHLPHLSLRANSSNHMPVMSM